MISPLLSLAVTLLCLTGSEQKSTPSGLRYEVLEPGDGGERPKVGDRVEIRFKQTLPDGTPISASPPGGRVARVRLGRILAGWTEGLQLMSPGAKYRFTIPSDLAFGSKGTKKVPPGSDLVCEMELISISIAKRAPDFPVGDPEKQVKLSSGLVYEVLTPGTGVRPKEGDKVDFVFTFWNEHGVFLDSTVLKGDVSSAKLENLPVPFLKEAMPLMKVGASWRFIVPSELGYGDRPRPFLEQGALTIWQVDLLSAISSLPLPEFMLPAEDQLQKTDSGLGYQVVKEGRGATPGPKSRVIVHFAAWQKNGTLFDASYPTGVVAGFDMKDLFPGWREAMALMAEGSVYRFVIPPDLAKGAKARGNRLPPGATLVLHVELQQVINR